MPAKRSGSEESDAPSSSPSPSKKPRTVSPKRPKSKYSADEERRFLETINRIVKTALWKEAKSDPVLSKRGADGMQQHWLAMYKKLSKSL